MKLLRRRATFGLLSYRTGRMHILQFSLKEPWLLPKCDRNYGEDKNIVLYGWLFIYFGYTDFKIFQKTKKEVIHMNGCCGTCKYGHYDKMQGYVCVNDESEYVADFVSFEHWCEDWESKNDEDD